MVVKRQWKLVSGGVVAAVTLGGGAALAQSGDPAPEVPQLQDVVDVTEVKVPSLVQLADGPVVQVVGDESPFSALSASQESTSEPSTSEPSVSEPSDSVSEQSVSEQSESVSEQSESVSEQSESVSEESMSEPSPESEPSPDSEPSPESESVPSAESDD